MSKRLIIEQKKIYDRIYFFTLGGNPLSDEIEETSLIGTAVIGKNKIY